jgi:hypothetical protein
MEPGKISVRELKKKILKNKDQHFCRVGLEEEIQKQTDRGIS